VAVVGLAIVHGRLEARPPRALADLRIGDVVLDRRHFLGLGIARPETLRPSEVRDAGVRRDAGAGQDDDASRAVDPAADEGKRALQVVGHDDLIPRKGSGGHVEGFAPGTLDALRAYAWPGNVRELEHAIERAVALARSSLLLPEDLPADVRAETKHAPELPPNRMTLEELKRWYVALVLDEAGGNKVRAAELLGIDRRTLYRILERESGLEE